VRQAAGKRRLEPGGHVGIVEHGLQVVGYCNKEKETIIFVCLKVVSFLQLPPYIRPGGNCSHV
jgi:hypothetical protein